MLPDPDGCGGLGDPMETDGKLFSSDWADLNPREAVPEIWFGEKHGCLLKPSQDSYLKH